MTTLSLIFILPCGCLLISLLLFYLKELILIFLLRPVYGGELLVFVCLKKITFSIKSFGGAFLLIFFPLSMLNMPRHPFPWSEKFLLKNVLIIVWRLF